MHIKCKEFCFITAGKEKQRFDILRYKIICSRSISVRHDGERAQEGPKASTSEGHIKAPIHS